MPELINKKIPSSLDMLNDVDDYVETISKGAEVSDELSQNLLMVLSEALTNAVKHGNKMDDSKFVYLKAWEEDGSLSISIRDEGEGFDPSALPDPLDPANLLKTSGRGVYLMNVYAERVSYNEKGNEVTITFSL